MSLIILAISISTHALDVRDSLRSDKLPEGWVLDLSKDSKGSIAPSPDGVLITVETFRHGLIKRDLNANGSDANPLLVSAKLKAMNPHDASLYLLWDNKNYVYFKASTDTHLHYGWVSEGVENAFIEHGVMRESKLSEGKVFGKEILVRALMVSRNLAFFVSGDGVTWRKLMDANLRPGPVNTAPKLLLGRGFPGDNAELSNDQQGDKKWPFKMLFSDVQITDNPAPGFVAGPDLVKKDSWELTLAALEPAGIPRSWTFLSPLGAEPKDWLLIEDWSKLRDQKAKLTSWERPEDDLDDSLVDLRDQIEHFKNSVVLCKTDVEWPVSGEAMLWFDCGDPVKLYVNNVLAFAGESHDWWQGRRAVKDRRAVPVFFNKGKNTIKLSIKQPRGEAQFFLRSERNDPAYRSGLLEKMIELFPPQDSGWRSAQALLTLAKLREDAYDFAGALKGYERAFKTLKDDEETRLRAHEGGMRVNAFLRDFDGASKTANAFLAAYPRADGSASAMRAMLRAETLAQRTDAARALIKQWSAPGHPSRGVLELGEMFQVIVGALAEKSDRVAQLAMLEELSGLAELTADQRARGAIESAVWRWEYERRKYSRASQPDPAELELACASLKRALGILPGSKNPAVQQLIGDADTLLKNKKIDNALGALWGATLISLTASESETAYFFALNKSYPITLPLMDKNKNEIKDQNQFKDELWRILNEKCADPSWASQWRFVGFKNNPQDKQQKIAGPETNADPGARYGDRAWKDVDPEADKTGRHEFGFDVRKFSGDSQVVYLARDFDSPTDSDSVLQLSNCGAWSAWLDGKLIGRELGPDDYRIEDDRLPLKLSKGRHRLLIKLDMPAEGSLMFRARIGLEPHLAKLLYIQALCAQQFPANPMDRSGDMNALREAIVKRTPPEAFLTFAELVSLVYDDQRHFGTDQITWASHHLREMNQDAMSVGALRGALRRLEDGPNFTGRAAKILEISRGVARALVHMGSTAEADAVLRDASNKYAVPAIESNLCLAWRGALRRDLGMSQAALPFFERCFREGPLNDEARQIVSQGLDWARFARPERILFESSRDVQSQLDGVRRQLSGAPEDAEKAMRLLGEILRGSSGSLVKVDESPFASRYVGAREFIRSLIDSFTPEQRVLYQKVVGEAAEKRLSRISQTDPAELEAAALEFPHTRESQAALNRAGNLYLDRGRYAQAISIFQTLLREPSISNGHGSAIRAKLTVALGKNGQASEADAARKDFEKTANAKNAAISQSLTALLKSAPKAIVAEQDSNGQFMGGLLRTGASSGPAPVPGGVVWAHPLIASGSLDNAKNVYGLDAQSHLQSHPVSDGTRVFLGAMESLRAFDLNSGKILWTQTWASGAINTTAAFTGFPSNVPVVGGGKVFVRAQSLASAMKCFDAETGEPRWNSEAQPDLRRLIWISDPTFAYGMIFAVCIEPGDFNLHCVAALDAETGRLRWRTPLANGNTGIKLNDIYFQASFHMGPPAVDAGELYVETGLSSVAALNAFTGEARWLSSYPRMSLGDPRRGQTNVFEFANRTFKVFSRAPLPPMISGSKIILAPLDSNGVMAFDRRDGAPLWHRELVDARYLAGIADGKILTCDEGLVALDAETGATAWKSELESGGLIGAPTLSGGVLYLPTRGALTRADALTGRVIGAAPWDARIGPFANMLVLKDRVIALAENAVIALGTANAGTKPLPLYEARRLEAEGRFEEAAERYSAALGSEKENLPLAAAARIRILKSLGRRDEALAEIAKFEKEAPEKLSAMGGLWSTRRDLIVRSLRKLLGENPPDPVPPAQNAKDGLKGVLAYSDSIPGDNPMLASFPGDSANRLYIRINGDVRCLNIGSSVDLLWSAYVGTNVKKLAAGQSILAALGDREITVLDRDSGETITRISMPRVGDVNGTTVKERALAIKRQRMMKGESFLQACIYNDSIITLSESRLSAWSASTGKQIWGRSFSISERTVENGLSTVDNLLIRVYHQHKDDLLISAYDPLTGTEIQTLNIEKQQRTSFSTGNRYMAARMGNKLTCVDLLKQVVLWKKDLPDFDLYQSTMEFTPEGQLRYAGPNKNDNNRHTVKHLDIATGNDTDPVLLDGPGQKSGAGLFTYTDRGFKITRMKVTNGALEPAWITKVPVQHGVGYGFVKAFEAGPFFHSIFVRGFDNGSREQMYLRTLAMDTGLQIAEQVLPGSPLITVSPNSSARVVSTNFTLSGGCLVYAAKEGIFIYRPQGESLAQAADSMRKEITDPGASLMRIKHLRRGLAGLEESESMAFITPADARVDGDLSEWKGTEPVQVSGRANYVALTQEAALNGPGDLSANIFSGWNQDGITIAVEVKDDSGIPPRSGAETSTGDRVRIVIDSRPGDNSSLELGECFSATLALGSGGPIFIQEFGAATESGLKPEGKVSPSVSGTGRQYELFVPWTALRKDSRERPGDKREIRLGVAVFDDDGSGTKGALEWGAGAALQTPMPVWLSRVSLIDASAEKIVRYRKVIDMLPGSPEALKFLKLILLSKRGVNADAENVAELERFVTQHPNSENTVRVLAMLKQAYLKMNDPNPTARMSKFIQSAKVPEELVKAMSAAFKVWVYPDPKNPPRTVMIQFSNNDWTNGVARGYWGAPLPQWGKDGTNLMRKIGDLPKPGQWTELILSPFDLGVESMDIRALGLTFAGGNLHFDNARINRGTSESVLIDDVLPDRWQAQLTVLQFVDAPKHDGAKSFTVQMHDPALEVHNIHLNQADWQNIITFFDKLPASVPAKTPAQLQEVYRRAAEIINDTQEGLVFLRKAIDLNTPEGGQKAFVALAMNEIKSFIKFNPGSPTGSDALKLAYEFQAGAGEPNPLAKCEELIREVKPSFAVTRQFYAARAPSWTEWHVLGPYQAVGERRGMEVTTESERAVNLNFATQSFGREIKWKKISSVDPKNPKADSSLVNLKAKFDAEKEAPRGPYFGYAYTKFNCPSKRRALIAFGADDVISIWIDGKRVVNEVYSYPQKDKESVEVQLRSGENEVLIKTGIQNGRLAFIFRVADLDGKPFDDIKNE